jgi:hypothetical protein
MLSTSTHFHFVQQRRSAIFQETLEADGPLTTAQNAGQLSTPFWTFTPAGFDPESGRWLLLRPNHFTNFDRFLEMIESMGFDPPLGRFHKQVGLSFLFAKIRTK